MAGSELLTFVSGQWQEADPSAPAELHAADSFLLRDGHVVAIERHLNRFRDAVADAHAAKRDDLEVFLELTRATLPDTGDWFPRIELAATGEGEVFRLWLRLAPPRRNEVTLAVSPTDTRRVPWRKGPDLERMAALREDVAARGASEALILADDGTVVEGAYSSLMVWSADSSTVFTTPADYARIPSVTEAVVTTLLHASGVVVQPRAHLLEELTGRDLWVVSALHGIRSATQVIDGPPLQPDRERRNDYQHAWLGMAAPV